MKKTSPIPTTQTLTGGTVVELSRARNVVFQDLAGASDPWKRECISSLVADNGYHLAI